MHMNAKVYTETALCAKCASDVRVQKSSDKAKGTLKSHKMNEIKKCPLEIISTAGNE